MMSDDWWDYDDDEEEEEEANAEGNIKKRSTAVHLQFNSIQELIEEAERGYLSESRPIMELYHLSQRTFDATKGLMHENEERAYILFSQFKNDVMKIINHRDAERLFCNNSMSCSDKFM